MTITSQMPPAAKVKAMAIDAMMRELRPHATDILITAEVQPFTWKAPGLGWSKTNDIKVAIYSSTKRVHVITAPGTGDLYFYK